MDELHLLYIPGDALRDRVFVRDFALGLPKLAGKAIVLHGTVADSPETAWFITKKLSDHLGEQMLPNVPVPPAQQPLLRLEADGDLVFDLSRARRLLNPVQALVLSCVSIDPEGALHFRPDEEVLAAVRAALPKSPVQVFPANPMAAVAANGPLVNSDIDATQLKAVYPENRADIDLALIAAPARLTLARDLGRELGREPAKV